MVNSIWKYILIIIIIFFYNDYNLNAQSKNFQFKHLNVDDGLSTDWIKAIHRDSEGYMWFGTSSGGMNKYDGYKFSIYKNDPKNINSLSHNGINIISEDCYGNLWVGVENGLNKYNRSLDVFNPISDFYGVYVNNILEVDSNRILLTSLYDLFIYYPKIDSIDYLLYREQNEYEFINKGLISYNDSIFFLATKNGLLYIDITNFKLLAIKDERIKNLNISSIYKDRAGRIWLGTFNKGLFCLTFNKNNYLKPIIINQHNIGQGSIFEIQEDNNDYLWIVSKIGGVNIINLKNYKNEIDIVIKDKDYSYNNLNNSLKGIELIYKDDEGTLWFGTVNDGVYYYNKILFKFNYIQKNEKSVNTLTSNNISAIYEEEEYLWLGTFNSGLNVYNRKYDYWEHYLHNENDPTSIGSNNICVIYKDTYNNIWIGTWEGGLNLYNRASKSFTKFFNNANDPNSISSNNVFGILQDNNGDLWIATMGGGLCKYNYNSKKFTRYMDDDRTTSISNNWVKTFEEDENGNLWIATNDRFNVFNKKDEEFLIYEHDTANNKSISSNQILDVFKDSKNNIWIGTENGLNLYNKDNNSFIYYNEKEGLANNVIRAICEDDKGNLWISTNNGLSKLINAVNRPENPEFKNYDKSDGLQGNQYNSRACYKGNNGILYFGGNNGLDIFNPDSIIENPFLPKVVITNFSIFNNPVEIATNNSPLNKHISQTKSITLSYKQSVFSFEYCGLNYLAPEKNRYAYKLDGFEKQWNYVGTKREATYTNIHPGKYVFMVKACNNDGLWNEEGAKITVIITPPYWQTWWFRISVLFILIGISFGYYFYRINSLKKQKEHLEKLVKERTNEIERKNKILLDQTDKLNEINTLLEERQQQLEEQSEELKVNTEEINIKNKDLEKSNATKDKLFSIIAHDIKNPFNTILGFSDLLYKRYDSYQELKRKRFIKLINDASHNVYELLENLLQWSRTQTNKISYLPQNFVLTEIINQNIILVKNTAENKGLKIENKITNDYIVYADRIMANTVIRNLLGNAIKYTEEGSITFEAKRKKDYIQVQIIDTGIGIKKDILKKILDTSEFITTEGTRGESGTGLGLKICQEFINMNKGVLSVKSNIGKGSEFLFTIPAGKD